MRVGNLHRSDRPTQGGTVLSGTLELTGQGSVWAEVKLA